MGGWLPLNVSEKEDVFPTLVTVRVTVTLGGIITVLEDVDGFRSWDSDFSFLGLFSASSFSRPDLLFFGIFSSTSSESSYM